MFIISIGIGTHLTCVIEEKLHIMGLGMDTALYWAPRSGAIRTTQIEQSSRRSLEDQRHCVLCNLHRRAGRRDGPRSCLVQISMVEMQLDDLYTFLRRQAREI